MDIAARNFGSNTAYESSYATRWQAFAQKSPPSCSRRRGTPSVQTRAVAPDKLKPNWAGDDMLSKLVNMAIQSKPLYGVMKIMVKKTMRDTAEGRGIPWEGNIRDLTSQLEELETIRAELENPAIEFPDYYLKPFHAYVDGNIGWEPAFEVEAASDAVALRVWKKETTLQPAVAQARLRGSIINAIREYSAEHDSAEVRDILDVGCSAGISTRPLADAYPAAAITGLDLSTHFLAVAELRERQHEGSTRRSIQYVHALGEATGMPDACFDLITLQFIIHECPQSAIRALVTEAKRLLRPNGVLAIIDNNPRSAVIQNLPPVLFTLMKSTEPWSDEYYAFDLEACMREAGLHGVRTIETDPRHRTVCSHM